MSSGFFLVSLLSASSPVANRRAVVAKARRAMREAIVIVVRVACFGEMDWWFRGGELVDDVGSFLV